MKKPALIAACLALLAFGALSCARESIEKTAKQDAREEKAISARVAQATTRRIVDSVELPGRTEAVESVEVRAQVSGQLDEIAFQAGSFVRKGDVLFKLDTRVYRAILAQRKSDVEAKTADLNRLEAELARQKGLIDKNATSMQQLELAQAERDQCKAELDAAIANVERAQIDVDYGTIVSPIDGEVSREQITVGNLVTAGTTLLTKIVAVDPVHVFFDVDERALLIFRERLVKELGAPRDFPVKFAVGDGAFDREATVDFAEPRVNETTGTLEFRAVASNPATETGARALVPGLRVRVLFPISPEYDAVLVPEEAIATDQNVKRVFVLTADNRAESRRVTLGALQEDNMRVVASGLSAGERVIVDNLLRVRDGSPIEPTEVPAASTTRIVREDGTIENADGTTEYDGLYEWSLERAREKERLRNATPPKG